MESINSYILTLKDKIDFDYKNKLKNNLTYFLRHFDSKGYIVITLENKKEFIQNLKDFIIEQKFKKYEKEYLNLIKSDDLDIFTFGEKVFIKDFYEKYSFRASTLLMKNILFETISLCLYHIYFFSTTLLSFEDYFYYNKRLVYDDKEKIKLISDYILYEADIFNCDNLTPTSFKLLSLGHLLKKNFIECEDFILENPCFAYARITLELHKGLKKSTLVGTFIDIKECYYAPATPMFFNSLTKYNLLSSCFLLDVEDTTSSIGSLLNKIAHIQKFNSGIGINFSKIRCKGRPVMEGAATSNGVDPFIMILGTLSDHFRNQKRQRSANVNIGLSIDHPDIMDFLLLKTANVRKEDKKLNNIFLTVSIPDEFIYRFLRNQEWYLISPDQTLDGKHLHDVYGAEYSKLYQRMIDSPSIEKKKIDISMLFSTLINVMIQTGSPFLFFKDIINYTSNHKHHGVLQGTNLCTEILEYYNENETACCNLTSLNLKRFVKEDKTFDFNLFEKKIYNIVYLLNNSIDKGLYSHISCKKSNIEKRPLGIGIQGLADMFNAMNIPYMEGKEIYRKISEALYYYAIKASNDLAQKKIFNLYDVEKQSPLNNGLFAFDLFKEYQMNKKNILKTIPKVKIIANKIKIDDLKTEFDWDTLRQNILKYGVTNSLLIAYMPTSLSSGIYNNNESFEMFTYNILKRDYSIYSIVTYNQKMVSYLLDNKYYDVTNVLNSMMDVEGDFMKLKNVPDSEKIKYSKQFETIYDVEAKNITRIISCNNQFVDQGKSTNIYISNNDNKQILKTIIDLWLLGTKTTYYYRPEIKINPKSLHDFQNETCYACVV